MTNKLKWRLSKLPTSAEVIELVNHKLITTEEAKEILFNQESDDTVTRESLESEIKFLRQLVNSLSNNNTIIEKIRYIEQPYRNTHWYRPYEVWCSANNTLQSSFGTSSTNVNTTGLNYLADTTGLLAVSGTGSGVNMVGVADGSFSEIKTFNQ